MARSALQREQMIISIARHPLTTSTEYHGFAVFIQDAIWIRFRILAASTLPPSGAKHDATAVLGVRHPVREQFVNSVQFVFVCVCLRELPPRTSVREQACSRTVCVFVFVCRLQVASTRTFAPEVIRVP